MTSLKATNLDSAVVTPVRMRGLSDETITGETISVGSGEPVVFLHGLVGLNEHWDGVVELVRDRLRCILLQIPLLDLRGRDCSIQGVSQLTADYLEQLRAELGAPPVLVGNSFGGHVACRVAIHKPELARALVLTGASGLLEKPLAETKRFKEIQTRPSKEWVAEKIGELFYDRQNVRAEDLERAHAALNVRGGARAMVRLSRTARRNNLTDELGQISAPTLLVWGREDIVTPPEAAKEFHRLLPNSRLEWFDRCGHVPMMEFPEKFSEMLVEFVGGLPPASDGDEN